MTFSTNTPFETDMLETIRQFDCELGDIAHTQTADETGVLDHIEIDGIAYDFVQSAVMSSSRIEQKRYLKRYAKLALFSAITAVSGQVLPYGSLTGIRPTALFRELVNYEGERQARKTFTETFGVNAQKMQLVSEINAVQQPYITADKNVIDIYVGIPFCTTRCAYCSFISAELSRCGNLVDDYITALKIEIAAAKQYIVDNGLKVDCIYVGGGTPTALSAEQLNDVLSQLNFGQKEFTVEAGRADTITDEKLAVIASAGANRISVNPQTLHDVTLEKIGRRHTAADFFSAYALARKYPLKINVDLIAALPDENYDMFMSSLRGVLEIVPDNITVHTLAIKRGSKLAEQNFKHITSNEVNDMVTSAYNELSRAMYKPYYMYRQKYMSGNLENVGYALGDSVLKYNIDIMEETTSIMALGANAVSKVIFTGENRIERVGNPKDIKTYIDKIQSNIEKRENLFKTLLI